MYYGFRITLIISEIYFKLFFYKKYFLFSIRVDPLFLIAEKDDAKKLKLIN